MKVKERRPQLKVPEALQVLAKNVYYFRNKKRLSQEELANAINVNIGTISRIERGLLNTSVSIVYAIGLALDVKPSLLLDEDSIK